MSAFVIGIRDAFKEGGWPMIPIAVLMILTWIIIVERVIYLMRCRVNVRQLLALLKSHIMAGNVQAAIQVCRANPAPVTKILAEGLSKFNRPDEEIQASMDESALVELPKIEKFTGYLPMIANVATLVGLLGTILGLIHSFAGVAGVNPSDKATLLAKGISEAMNCTAFGLICAVPGLLAYAALNGWTQSILDEINATSVQVLNLVVSHRGAMKQH